MTEAVFHKFGYIRCSNDKLNSFDKGLAIDLLVCFNIHLPGPVALLTLRVFRMSLTSLVSSADRSKAVVPVLSYSLLLCGLFYEAICCMSFRVSFCSCVFQSF